VTKRANRSKATPASGLPESSDPDPFTIGLGIFAALAGGGAFLEARRQRQFIERQQRERFRAAWFSARRTLIHFEQVIDEFETYMLEDDYAESAFRIGAVPITVDRGRHQALHRLKGQAMTTANVLTDTLDDLSEFLGADDQEMIERILSDLAQIELPSRYADVIKSARKARNLYAGLLSNISKREGFERTS
jgi:hypothetical protein